ncbi:hypothetical protein EVAR_83717_1 [Eumeta japonica]|uniref:Uncharacterized protein n=1 Tax=Eumeta variegata TaxID=151549 RepID=A0A4C1W9E3_EUMVA|nr:hypothetical protein EVAR_83717_1 [Eumeta japonica]
MLVDADRIEAARIDDPLGVDLTERACRPLIRLSTHPTAAARAARVSKPRPSTSSFCPRSRCQSGAYAGPPAGVRVIAHALSEGGAPGCGVVVDEGGGGARLSHARVSEPVSSSSRSGSRLGSLSDRRGGPLSIGSQLE